MAATSDSSGGTVLTSDSLTTAAVTAATITVPTDTASTTDPAVPTTTPIQDTSTIPVTTQVVTETPSTVPPTTTFETISSPPASSALSTSSIDSFLSSVTEVTPTTAQPSFIDSTAPPTTPTVYYTSTSVYDPNTVITSSYNTGTLAVQTTPILYPSSTPTSASSSSTSSSATSSSSASATADAQANLHRNSSISTGAKIGIGVGIASALVALAVIFVICFGRRRRRRLEREELEHNGPVPVIPYMASPEPDGVTKRYSPQKSLTSDRPELDSNGSEYSAPSSRNNGTVYPVPGVATRYPPKQLGSNSNSFPNSQDTTVIDQPGAQTRYGSSSQSPGPPVGMGANIARNMQPTNATELEAERRLQPGPQPPPRHEMRQMQSPSPRGDPFSRRQAPVPPPPRVPYPTTHPPPSRAETPGQEHMDAGYLSAQNPLRIANPDRSQTSTPTPSSPHPPAPLSRQTHSQTSYPPPTRPNPIPNPSASPHQYQYPQHPRPYSPTYPHNSSNHAAVYPDDTIYEYPAPRRMNSRGSEHNDVRAWNREKLTQLRREESLRSQEGRGEAREGE